MLYTNYQLWLLISLMRKWKRGDIKKHALPSPTSTCSDSVTPKPVFLAIIQTHLHKGWMKNSYWISLKQIQRFFSNTSGSAHADSESQVWRGSEFLGEWCHLTEIFQLLCRTWWSQSQTHLTCVLEIPIPCEMAEDV